MSEAAPLPTLTRKDFVNDVDPRWCPGCGDYSILAQTQKVMPDFGYPRENIVFISGIGCSGRLPYYMNTYGFHTIHGRAPTIATGLKAARPDLMVWVITGDGDALSIGGNHLLHSMRRNVDLRLVMFNNRIYGLTKGQASPTSEFGKRTKSTPLGSIDYPVQPLTVALAAEASFVARSVDTHTEHLQTTLNAAGFHRGSAFIEVLQNCNIFNDGAWRDFTDREVRDDRTLVLEHGKPMIFGKTREQGIRLRGLHPEVVTIGKDGVTEGDLLVHDAHAEEPHLALILSRMWWPDYPVPVGVLRDVTRPTHDQLLGEQVVEAVAQQGEGDLAQALVSGETWTVVAEERSVDTRAIPEVRSARTRTRGLICPVCRFQNFEGEDACENCGADLRTSDIPQQAGSFTGRLMGEHLDALGVGPPPSIEVDAPVVEAIARMHRESIDCLLVIEDGALVGIFTERDAVLKLAGRSMIGVGVREVMTLDPVVLRHDEPIAVAINKMAVGGFRHIPIVDEGSPIGVVAAKDVFEHILELVG
ncbi:MAG TPA: thiamine pyrophosphate-dependent enzyme [Candidatus Limnocylindrales bacterium]|nr:thiamine pyrophosphate-dependent enzyme [Candidatus Limnocylindrales bacterium]